MSLLPVTAAVPIFAPLVGRRVGVVFYPGCGNAGDRLIELATRQLLDRFGVDYLVVDPEKPGPAEVLLVGAGGCYGHPCCPVEADRRRTALATGRPCVLLPQTAYGREPSGYVTAFVRDDTSRRFVPDSVLAPDPVMCWEPPAVPAVARGTGEFFSDLPEGLFPDRGTDPRDETDPLAYFAFVAGHAVVHTDSLHCAVMGLAAGRDVTLYPTRLHKNRSWWEAWGKWLGCRWAGGQTGRGRESGV